MVLSDNQFIDAFEQKSLSPDVFNHQGHLRLAWLYLQQYPLEVAIEKLNSGICEYANSLGAAQKFHFTLTTAITKIIYQRVQQSGASSFELFIAKNQDLLTNMQALVLTYYSESLLNSAAARVSFVAPDLKPL